MHTRLNHTQSRRTHSSHQHHWLLNSKSFRKNSIQQEHYHSNQLWNTHISYGKRLQSPVPFQPTTAHASIGIHSHHHNKRNCNLKFSVRQKSEKTIKKQKKMIRVWRIREKRCVLEERVQKRKTHPGSWLSMSQISMFMAQSGPMSMSLVARSTMEFTISSGHRCDSKLSARSAILRRP